MKFKIQKAFLKSALDKCSPVLPVRANLPVLSCALISNQGGKLTITTTNCEQRISAITECISLTDGAACIPFKRLQEWVDKVSGEILIEVKSEGIATLKCGSARGSIATLEMALFPGASLLSRPLAAFRDSDGDIPSSLRRVKCAASTDQSRAVLNGVHFRGNGSSVTLECSDGRRGHQVELSIKASVKCIVPTLAIDAICSLFDDQDSQYEIFENRICVTSSNAIFESKLIEGGFPDFQRVIPAVRDTVSEFDAKQMLDAIKVSFVMKDEASRVFLTSQEGGINVLCKNEKDDSEYFIESKQKHPFDICINGEFLRDAISNLIEPRAKMEFGESQKDPVCFRDGNFLSFISPMFVQK